MSKVYSYTQAVQADIVDAYCVLQKGFTDQFVYYDKQRKARVMGLGRCIAVNGPQEMDYVAQGPDGRAPVFFSFNWFDADNPSEADELFASFPRLQFLLPELVLIEDEKGVHLQINSLGPVYEGRITRFARQIASVPARVRETIAYSLEADSRENWTTAVETGLSAIDRKRVNKVVLSRRQKLQAEHPFSSKDLLVNLIDGPARGVVVLYRYGDVFFCGCTPELLVRKQGKEVESMCLAGTIGVGSSEEERARLADELLHDDKNLREHAYVVDYIGEVFRRNCYDVNIGAAPEILSLPNVQHLYTPVKGSILEGKTVVDMARQLHPTPALSGSPVGEAMMLIRQIEGYNRGLFGGAVGFVDGDGDGEFSVALRTGVFDGEIGWVYAGCGIVDGSVASEEYDEIDMKLKTILSAFEGE